MYVTTYTSSASTYIIVSFIKWTWLFEPQRKTTDLLRCTLNEDSNHTAHPRSPIRVFVLGMKRLCFIVYSKCTQWNLLADYANAQPVLNSLGAQIWRYVIRRCGTRLYLPSYHPPVRSSPLLPLSLSAESPRQGILLSGGSLPDLCAS